MLSSIPLPPSQPDTARMSWKGTLELFPTLQWIPPVTANSAWWPSQAEEERPDAPSLLHPKGQAHS